MWWVSAHIITVGGLLPLALVRGFHQKESHLGMLGWGPPQPTRVRAHPKAGGVPTSSDLAHTREISLRAQRLLLRADRFWRWLGSLMLPRCLSGN